MSATISTSDYEISLAFQILKTGKPKILQGYVDTNYAGDLDQRRSTIGYVSQ